MSEIKLLTCPFCGGEAEMEEDYSYGHGLLFSYKPHCSKCGCNIGMFSDKTEAIEQWNTRKPMERILTRFEGLISKRVAWVGMSDGFCIGVEKAIEIVKEEGGIE